MAAHSTLGASSAERWFECPGSVALIATVPSPPESSYAAEGTRAHEAIEHFFKHSEFPKGLPLEMVEACTTYINTIFEDERKVYAQSHSLRFIEKRLDLSSIHPVCFGTSDTIVIYPNIKLMQVLDFKYGAGIAVDVSDNVQMKYYGLGALIELKSHYEIEDVELVIVQPRAVHSDGPVRRWRTTADHLLTEFAMELELKAYATEDPEAPLKSGSHCRFCPAKAVCPELNRQALATAQMEFRKDLSYEPAKLSAALAMIPAVKAWIAGVEEFAINEALEGRIPPGHKLVQSRGRRVWPSKTDATTILLEFGLSEKDALEAPTLKSPAQIEKLLSKTDKEHLKTLTINQQGGVVLAHESDKRPAANVEAASEFSVIPTT